jgi:flagellar protein FliO/FliZ
VNGRNALVRKTDSVCHGDCGIGMRVEKLTIPGALPLLSVGLLLPGLLWAAGERTVNAALPLAKTGYVEAIAGLLLVVVLILGLGWALKRMGITPANKGAVRVLGGVSLGGRERALVLEAEGKRILVGVSPGQVRPLMRLDDVSHTSAALPEDQEFSQQLERERLSPDDGEQPRQSA